MSKNPEDWTLDQFKAYLLIYASYADLEFSESEKESILEVVDKGTFEKVRSYYDKMGEFQRLDFIMKSKNKFFSTPESKSSMMAMLSEHFKVDGEVSKLEVSMYDFLDRLL